MRGVHHHSDLEELLCVLKGRVRFDTPDGGVGRDPPRGVLRPDKGRTGGYAVGEDTAHGRAIGESESERHVVREPCVTCGLTMDRAFERNVDGRIVVLYRSECGTECEQFAIRAR